MRFTVLALGAVLLSPVLGDVQGRNTMILEVGNDGRQRHRQVHEAQVIVSSLPGQHYTKETGYAVPGVVSDPEFNNLVVDLMNQRLDPGSSWKSCETRPYDCKTSRGLPIVGALLYTSLTECARLCDSTSQCRGFVDSHKKKECNFKDNVVDGKYIKGDGTVKELYDQDQAPPPPLPVHCGWNDWLAWSACSLDCGGGVMTRTRMVHTSPEHGGSACESDEGSESQQCNTQACQVTHPPPTTTTLWESYVEYPTRARCVSVKDQTLYNVADRSACQQLAIQQGKTIYQWTGTPRTSATTGRTDTSCHGASGSCHTLCAMCESKAVFQPDYGSYEYYYETQMHPWRIYDEAAPPAPSCTVPTITAGVSKWMPESSDCASGANVLFGTHCHILSEDGYVCKSPGLCNSTGSFQTEAACFVQQPNWQFHELESFKAHYGSYCGGEWGLDKKRITAESAEQNVQLCARALSMDPKCSAMFHFIHGPNQCACVLKDRTCTVQAESWIAGNHGRIYSLGQMPDTTSDTAPPPPTSLATVKDHVVEDPPAELTRSGVEDPPAKLMRSAVDVAKSK